MKRDYYSDSIAKFRDTSANEILGILTKSSGGFSVEPTQRDAWLEQIRILRTVLSEIEGSIYFEYAIPRMGKRIDVVLIIGSVIFVLEFKVGESDFTSYALNQAWDYTLDLKNFHETSRECFIAPVVIATKAGPTTPIVSTTSHNDKVLSPIRCNVQLLGLVLERVLEFADDAVIDPTQWESGRYSPTPTIVEAAMALYNN